jgi:acetyltransferase-like isoleucine patch superfamily enzyme
MSMTRSLRRWFRSKKRKPAPIRERFEVGRYSYGEPKIMHWGEQATLKVGAFCSIAEGVTIFLGGNHRVDWITTFPFTDQWPSAKNIEGHPHTKGDVIIGHDVWIGANATILSGVKIGTGAVVGAGAVVSKDVPPYTIVAGNPAQPVKRRFDDASIASLLRICWWEWPDEKLNRAMPLLLSGNVAGLVAFAEASNQ